MRIFTNPITGNMTVGLPDGSPLAKFKKGREAEAQAFADEAGAKHAAARLDYLRAKILAERISYGEIAELQSLKEHIDPADTLLLEWADATGVA